MKIKLAIITLTLLGILIYLHYSGFYNLSYIHIGEIPTIFLILISSAVIVYYEHQIKSK